MYKNVFLCSFPFPLTTVIDVCCRNWRHYSSCATSVINRNAVPFYLSFIKSLKSDIVCNFFAFKVDRLVFLFYFLLQWLRFKFELMSQNFHLSEKAAFHNIGNKIECRVIRNTVFDYGHKWCKCLTTWLHVQILW